MHNSMCLSLLKIPKYPHATTSWLCRFPIFSKRCNPVSTIKIISSSNSDLDRRQYRRQSRKTLNTQPEISKTPSSLSSKAIIENDTSKEADNAKVGTIKSWATTGTENTQIFPIQQLIAERKDLSKHVTFIAFDLETTGFRRQRDRIIEVAFQDLGGGINSTLQTLVNPQCFVTNHEIHNITTQMVNRPEVPRMIDLIPILMKWIESRRKPDGIVVLIAHNARTFDVPFLTNEFSRCSYEFPLHWFFLDTLPLAREVIKSRGLPGNAKLSLGALCELYNISAPSNAHRALVDVKMLSLVYQRMTFELEYTIRRVLEEVSRQSEASNSKKKKTGGKP